MFSVRWVTHLGEIVRVETENSSNQDLDELFFACLTRLPAMRMKPFSSVPDGFLIFGAGNSEVRRWFGSPKQIIEKRTAEEVDMHRAEPRTLKAESK
jgi:hypothetical protein